MKKGGRAWSSPGPVSGGAGPRVGQHRLDTCSVVVQVGPSACSHEPCLLLLPPARCESKRVAPGWSSPLKPLSLHSWRRCGAARTGRGVPHAFELRGARRAEGLKLTLLKAAAGGRGAWRTFWMSDRAWVDVVTMNDPDLSAARN